MCWPRLPAAIRRLACLFAPRLVSRHGLLPAMLVPHSPLAASLMLAGPFAVLGAPLLAGAALAVIYDIAMWRSFRLAA